MDLTPPPAHNRGVMARGGSARLALLLVGLCAGAAAADDGPSPGAALDAGAHRVISAPDTVVNVAGALVSTAPAGSLELEVSGAVFPPGRLLLLVQSQDVVAGADSDAGDLDLSSTAVGRFEFARAASVFGTRVRLEAPLAQPFTAPGAQVVSVPEYDSLTITADGGVVAPAWDGVRGGVVALVVRGALVNDGLVSAAGRGFRGGGVMGTQGPADGGVCAEESGRPDWYSRGGEGVGVGSHQRLSRAAAWGGGGAGACTFGGGGGGSNAGSGGRGGGAPSEASQNFGFGARPLDAAALRLLAGGGGGGGHWAISYGTAAASGGAGGGVLLAQAEVISGAGRWLANGASPGLFGGGDWGYGGGGAGGTVWLRSQQLLGCGLVEARGGAGGTNSNGKGPGGGGGGGRVYLEGASGSSCPASVAGGPGGISTGRYNPGRLGAEPESGALAPWAGLVVTSAPPLEPLRDGGLELRITSTANPLAYCGVPYRYGVALLPTVAPADLPPTFSLEPASDAPLPDGLTVNPVTGELSWRPGNAQAGVQRFVLVATVGAVVAREPIEVVVECERPRIGEVGCGCASASGASLGLMAGVGWALSSWRRRPKRGRGRG